MRPFLRKMKMARTAEFWLQVRRNFDPHETLVGRRSDAFYCERRNSPFNGLLAQFSEPRNPPRAVFLTGQSGSGISSFLLHSIEQFQSSYFPIYLDIGHNLNVERANRIDLLFLLGVAIQNAATNEGLSPDPENLIVFVQSVRQVNHLTEGAGHDGQWLTEMAKSAISFGASSLRNERKFAAASLVLPAFYSGVDDDVAQRREIEPPVREMINNLNLIIADVETLSGKPVLLVADGLNKLSGPSQIENVFLNSDTLRAPICNIIYTAPLSVIAYRNLFQPEEIRVLPNFTPGDQSDDYHRNGSRHHPEYEVVERRLSALDLEIEQLFDPGALDLLISKSGGLIRLFLSLVSDSCKQAELMGRDWIDIEAARNAVENYVASLALRLNREIVAKLHAMRQDWRSSCSGLSPEIINSQLIVAHKSDDIRFDVHPIIYDEVFGKTLPQRNFDLEAVA